MEHPGSITLIGSGETSNIGGQIYEILARQLPAPLTISVLETPAGFEANAQRVAGRVAEFFEARLQNFQPQVTLISARKKGTPFSPDAPEVVQPLYTSQMIFFGPGSPTYTVRQLENSLAWNIIQARQRLGASLVLASAATVAVSRLAVPVYEIFKVGEDPYWKPGLDLFAPYGLSLVVIPHWNNREGGDDVDTSRCFIGQERFDLLRSMLPEGVTIVGIDEHTALTVDFAEQSCHVRGVGQVHISQGRQDQECSAGCSFSIQDLGDYHPLSDRSARLPAFVWSEAQAAAQHGKRAAPKDEPVPAEVEKLVKERQKARQGKEWARADELRSQIAGLGWQVKDTPDGPVVVREN